MILDERLITFINSLDRGNSEGLEEIKKAAQAENVPIIRQDMQAFMRFLMASNRPKNILEVGAAVGFSAILMAENTPKDTKITTIENWEPRIPVCLNNIKALGYENRITLLQGDAGEIVPRLRAEGRVFDFIFMDAAKGQYPVLLEDILAMLSAGGLLVTDNVLSDGDIIESRFAIERRDRTIHKRMRDYLYELTHDDRLVTSVLAVGDGAAVSVKK